MSLQWNQLIGDQRGACIDMTDPRILQYQERYQCQLLGYLGAGPGQDGFVLKSDRLTAVKFFDRIDRFSREFEVYLLLEEEGIQSVVGHAIPEAIRAD